MKKVVLSFAFIIFAYLLQTTLMPAITLANVCPNLLLIIVVYIGYINGRTYGLFMGLISGLLYDFQFGTLIGLYGLIYMIIGYISGICHKIYFREDYTLPVVLVTINGFLYGFFVYITGFLLRGKLDLDFYFSKVILPEIVYTVLLSIFIYKIVISPLSWAKRKKEVQVNAR